MGIQATVPSVAERRAEIAEMFRKRFTAEAAAADRLMAAEERIAEAGAPMFASLDERTRRP